MESLYSIEYELVYLETVQLPEYQDNITEQMDEAVGAVTDINNNLHDLADTTGFYDLLRLCSYFTYFLTFVEKLLLSSAS